MPEDGTSSFRSLRESRDGSKRYADELAFRDHLQENPQIAAEYLALKRNLASRFANDREAYTNAKSDFVRRVLGRER